ncbi:hypothetical protein IE81DRAFT_344456 [Ceraceosorus guamensis]|uniref:Shugoshin C-terminal domain-containing protein n=1 Tax=Ceraceosorus guamensis TaxID=1522189 RepID=A0A316WBC0_9BASI|nr:hypothetical protein IE81DRAFT_344456 [Ceraceosorus guamensis]PWN45981.1 hypothetical protein IE81DRAFT_344456 [Ceraceosorus guamensis]
MPPSTRLSGAFGNQSTPNIEHILEHFDQFKRKHIAQNRDIIKTNALAQIRIRELESKVRQMEAERAEHSHVVNRLEIALARYEHYMRSIQRGWEGMGYGISALTGHSPRRRSSHGSSSSARNEGRWQSSERADHFEPHLGPAARIIIDPTALPAGVVRHIAKAPECQIANVLEENEDEYADSASGTPDVRDISDEESREITHQQAATAVDNQRNTSAETEMAFSDGSGAPRAAESAKRAAQSSVYAEPPRAIERSRSGSRRVLGRTPGSTSSTRTGTSGARRVNLPPPIKSSELDLSGAPSPLTSPAFELAPMSSLSHVVAQRQCDGADGNEDAVADHQHKDFGLRSLDPPTLSKAPSARTARRSGLHNVPNQPEHDVFRDPVSLHDAAPTSLVAAGETHERRQSIDSLSSFNDDEIIISEDEPEAQLLAPQIAAGKGEILPKKSLADAAKVEEVPTPVARKRKTPNSPEKSRLSGGSVEGMSTSMSAPSIATEEDASLRGRRTSSRSRTSVNYALPKLNTKMRKPDPTDLVPATSSESLALPSPGKPPSRSRESSEESAAGENGQIQVAASAPARRPPGPKQAASSGNLKDIRKLHQSSAEAKVDSAKSSRPGRTAERAADESDDLSDVEDDRDRTPRGSSGPGGEPGDTTSSRADDSLAELMRAAETDTPPRMPTPDLASGPWRRQSNAPRAARKAAEATLAAVIADEREDEEGHSKRTTKKNSASSKRGLVEQEDGGASSKTGESSLRSDMSETRPAMRIRSNTEPTRNSPGAEVRGVRAQSPPRRPSTLASGRSTSEQQRHTETAVTLRDLGFTGPELSPLPARSVSAGTSSRVKVVGAALPSTQSRGLASSGEQSHAASSASSSKAPQRFVVPFAAPGKPSQAPERVATPTDTERERPRSFSGATSRALANGVRREELGNGVQSLGRATASSEAKQRPTLHDALMAQGKNSTAALTRKPSSTSNGSSGRASPMSADRSASTNLSSSAPSPQTGAGARQRVAVSRGSPSSTLVSSKPLTTSSLR